MGRICGVQQFVPKLIPFIAAPKLLFHNYLLDFDLI